MRFCTVLMLAMCGAATGACSGGDDEPPPGRDGGPTPDGPAPDGPAPDGPAPDASGDRAPPTILETEPADGATGVEPTLAITVRFDEPVLVREPGPGPGPEPGPGDGLTLLDQAGQPVPGTVEVDGNALRFVPASDLALLGSYTAVVTPAITDVAGNALPAERRVHLSVRDGRWDATATPLDHDGAAYLSSPDVAMDPRGNAVAVWSQQDALGSSIWASHHRAGADLWETVQLTEHAYFAQASAPRVAMDGAGHAIAVWQQFDGPRFHVWASRHDGAGWSEPVRLSRGNTGDAYDPRIAMNDAGAAIVVWRHVQGITAQAWINRHEPGLGWGEAGPVLVNGHPAPIRGWDYTSPQLGIDARGDAIVLVLGHMDRLVAVPHLAASGWGEAETLSQDTLDAFALAMAPSGHAFALRESREPPSIQAWRRDPDGASHSDLLMLADEDASGVRVGDVEVNAAGDGIALWFQDWPGLREVWASEYSATAQAWTAPQGLLPPISHRPRSAQVAMDPRGHAHAIWILSDGNDYLALMTTRRVAPGGFGPATLHEGVENASLAVNAQGKAVVIRAVQSADRQRIALDAVLFR